MGGGQGQEAAPRRGASLPIFDVPGVEPVHVKVRDYYRDMYGKIAGIGVLAGVSAQFQAATLVLVVLLGKTMASSSNNHHYVGSIGPFHVDLSAGRMTSLAAIAVVISAVLDTVIGWVKTKMTTHWDFVHREQVVAEYLQADYATQASERMGTLSIITGYVSRGTGLLGALMSGVVNALCLVTYLGVALLIDYRAAILMVGSLIFISIILRPVMRRIKSYGRAQSQEMIRYSRDITEATRMVRDLRVFNALDALGAQITTRSARLARIRQRGSFINGLVSPIYQYLAILIVLGALAVAQAVGTTDIVKLGAIALLLVRSMSFGQGLQGTYQNIVDGVPYLEQLEQLRALYRKHRTADGSLVLEKVHSLELSDVRYSYDGVVDAVAGVSAEFHVGEIVGIVGPSGGGKSTLSQLLLRLRDPTDGEIRINGIATDEYKMSSFYRHVSLVPQDPRLFHTTVAENISLFDPSITREQIIDAAKAAGVHEVIEALDDGYETKIGPAFRDLSGGQIQRVGIARALARGAQILVLDEPTSALDVHSEAVIQATLEGLKGHALVVIIAHRLSTLSICDRIMVLRDGEVETIGSLAYVSEQSDFFKRALEAGTLEIGVADRRKSLPAPAGLDETAARDADPLDLDDEFTAPDEF
jgi:ATP-binding cassette, subfamily B, bacterial